jgi:hypothetical protein
MLAQAGRETSCRRRCPCRVIAPDLRGRSVAVALEQPLLALAPLEVWQGPDQRRALAKDRTQSKLSQRAEQAFGHAVAFALLDETRK